MFTDLFESAARRSRGMVGSLGHSASPPQIRACGFPALGSSRGESESSSKSLPRVEKARTGQRKADEPLVEPVPREPALASAPERTKPAAEYFIVEAVQRMPVARQTVVAIVASENAAQPPMLLWQRRVHTTPLFGSHRMELPSESLPVRRFTTKRPSRPRAQ